MNRVSVPKSRNLPYIQLRFAIPKAADSHEDSYLNYLTCLNISWNIGPKEIDAPIYTVVAVTVIRGLVLFHMAPSWAGMVGW